MCSNFSKIMENYQIQGDLSDVVRATAADGGATPSWQFPRNTLNYSSPQSDHQDFGDPFSHIRDPLMQNSNTTPLSEFFFAGDGAAAVSNSGINGGGVSQSHGGLDDEMKRPPNLFSKMLQISPCDSPAEVAAAPPQRGLKGPPYNLQISSPRNTGIKRRKSQAKKVVCIPAPTPANSRATGEIVPSDLWAWRKYGQKPIKGSPYPRGYYRCSSSKGCLARKQVERSRTDPNMLVITYTSDHNHPWPTQRNALAGSTRSQPSKKPMTTKQQQKENSSTMEDNCPDVKEELNQELDTEFDEVFPNTYKPTFTDSSSNHHQDTFFADLGEIGDDALDNLDLFQQGFSGDDKSDLDPFSFYDWGTDADNIAAASSGEESNRRS